MMKRSFYIILISVFVFIATNTLFYINIYHRQVNFQTDLLAQQIRICGNTIEKRGLNFENEVNFILFSDDIAQLFNDPNIKEIGSKNLELFYSKYADLINKVTIYDNEKNVYSLILDKKNKFVSDYYESQRQVSLQSRDQLFFENGKSYFTLPIFLENQVHSNILIEVDFNRYIQIVFDQYKLENTLWQWLLTGDGKVDTTFTKDIEIKSVHLKKISADISEISEGSLVHTIDMNGESMKVISVYYPVRLIRQDYGIVFSMKTDLFLQSIYLKTIIITIASLLLLSILLFIHFRIVNVQSKKAKDQSVSEQALFSSINQIPAGIIIINNDNTIRLINHTAIDYLYLNTDDQFIGEPVDKLNLDEQLQSDHPIYSKVFGEGFMLTVRKDNFERILYKNDWYSQLDQDQVRFVMLFDITHFEKTLRLKTVAQIAKSGLLDNMSQEISVPLSSMKKAITRLGSGKAKESVKDEIDDIRRNTDLLENLVNSIFDFSRLETDELVVEKVPYKLREEVNLAIEPFKNLKNRKNISIITKIRSDVPDKIIGDPFRLRQVLKNLIENAFETTREGRIFISAELVEHHADTARVKISIEDTGNGYSGDIIEDFFDSANYNKDYWKDQYGETGLRLLIARQHIELMRGSIQIESPSSISTNPKQPGTNCFFFIEFTPEASLIKDLDFKEIKSFSQINCLVLNQLNDPDENSYKLLEEMGITIHHRIYRNNNLESVTQYLREESSGIHILFIIDKPETDGFILASELNEQDLAKQFIIILVSENNLPGNYQRAIKHQVDLYLAKPFESHTLFEFIKTHFTSIPEADFQKSPKGVRINANTSILLAEDNLFSRKVSQALFKRLGFEIDLAFNGNEVMEMVKTHNYDIIFMDLLMPVKDGLQTTDELRKQGFKMPIVALTAVEPEKSKSAARAVGINDYLIKPASIERIREILLRLFPENV